MTGFCLATGVAAGRRALDALCRVGLAPTLAVGYSVKLAARSGYTRLDDLAAMYNIPLVETSDINGADFSEAIEQYRPDLLVVAGWSQIVCERVLARLPLGAVGLHPTRLPDGRGRAPIPWTLIKGLDETAVTLFHLEPDVDSGDIIGQFPLTVSLRDDAESLYERIAEAHAALLLEHIPKLLTGSAPRRPQGRGGQHWPRRQPEDGRIDWSRPALELYNWIRGLTHPYPGSFTHLDGSRMTVWSADLVDVDLGVAPAGTVMGPVWSTGDDRCGVAVAAGRGFIVLHSVQWEGEERIVAIKTWDAGRLKRGVVLG